MSRAAPVSLVSAEASHVPSGNEEVDINHMKSLHAPNLELKPKPSRG
ncbi:unnamed protein product [Tetraodon nigroviridis]|uniref:(spotted green pufferfish) hypothetical protein n=1 Tax=Tetraodon nigroviridis TaxID=99883 RepID=Q4SGE2_TETNG|nr:unnamed protein product [Tetraodon nigroviridis]